MESSITLTAGPDDDPNDMVLVLQARALWGDMYDFGQTLRSKWKHGQLGEEAAKVVDELYKAWREAFGPWEEL